MRDILKKITLTIVSILIAFIAFDLVMRISGVTTRRSGVLKPKVSPNKLNSETVVLPPDYKGNLHSKEFNVLIQTNSLGFREREINFKELSHRKPYLFIGDSFFIGWGVERNKRFSEHFTTLLQSHNISIPVINIACPGWGTYNYYDILKIYATSLNPRLVIIGFFVGNDFLDDYNILENSIPKSGMRSGGYNIKMLIREFLETSPVVNHATSLLWRFPKFRNTFNKMELTNNRLFLYEKGNNSFQEKVYHYTSSVFNKISAFTLQTNIPVLVVIIPDHLQVLSPSLFSGLSILKPQIIIKNRLDKLGIPYLDLYEHFLFAEKASSLFFNADKHWNENGHDFVANIVFEYLYSNFTTVHSMPLN